jgi:hypothetical protein
MNTISKSVLAGFLLVLLFALAFVVASENDYYGFCDDADCVVSVVVDGADYGLCDSIVDSDVCYFRLSRIYNDSELCLRVLNSSDCIYDFALFNRDYSYCFSLGNLSDNCVFDVAVRLGNFSLCEMTSNKYYCYYSYALWSGDSDLCEKSENYKNACIKKLLGS